MKWTEDLAYESTGISIGFTGHWSKLSWVWYNLNLFLNCEIGACHNISWDTEWPGFTGNAFQPPCLGAFSSERGQRLREDTCSPTFSLTWNLGGARNYPGAEELEAILVHMQFKPLLGHWMGLRTYIWLVIRNWRIGYYCHRPEVLLLKFYLRAYPTGRQSIST